MIRIHPSITEARVVRVVENCTFGLDNTGICLSCGEEQEGHEPDAVKDLCDICGERAVYGGMEILIMGAYHDS